MRKRIKQIFGVLITIIMLLVLHEAGHLFGALLVGFPSATLTLEKTDGEKNMYIPYAFFVSCRKTKNLFVEAFVNLLFPILLQVIYLLQNKRANKWYLSLMLILHRRDILMTLALL